MEKYMERTKNHFNKTAESYDESSDGKFVKPMYQGLVDELNHLEEGCLLDIGCGTGNELSMINNDKLELYGIDLSEQMVKEAGKKLGSKAVIKVSDAENLPFESNKFEYIVCNASFHHYIHPDEALREMRRVIKKNGTLFIGEGYIIQPFRSMLNFSFKFSDSGDYHSYGRNEMKKIMTKNGFKLETVNKISDHTVLYIATAY